MFWSILFNTANISYCITNEQSGKADYAKIKLFYNRKVYIVGSSRKIYAAFFVCVMQHEMKCDNISLGYFSYITKITPS